MLQAAAYSRSHRVTGDRHGELHQIYPHIIIIIIVTDVVVRYRKAGQQGPPMSACC